MPDIFGSKSWTFVKTVSLALGIFVFWFMRLTYWKYTNEVPFSDMQNYYELSFRVLKHLDYSWSDFWQTMNVPTLVTLRAMQMYLWGESLTVWRVFQTSILFAGLIWLCYELYRATSKFWLPTTLIWIVALSKSSIFWSYKLSRESLAEAFIYLCCASSLYAIRKQKLSAYLLCGVIVAACFLNRSNFVILVPCLLALFSFGAKGINITRRIAIACVFMLGLAVVWSPWIARSISIYGKPVLLSTQGGIAFFWELGLIEASYNGRPVRIHSDYFFIDAPKVFKNDYEADKFLKKEVRRWLAGHWRSYLTDLIPKRFYSTIQSFQEGLTKVSRAELFYPYGKPWDLFLFDKVGILIISGMIGLVLLAREYGYALLLPALVVIPPFLFTLLIIGYPRMLDPLIPLILFGNTGWLYLNKASGLRSETHASV